MNLINLIIIKLYSHLRDLHKDFKFHLYLETSLSKLLDYFLIKKKRGWGVLIFSRFLP